VSLATSFAALVTAISFTVRLATDCIAATGTAVALAAITTHADREHGATLSRAAHLQTKDGFSPADRPPHFGIMPDLMIGRMTLPAADDVAGAGPCSKNYVFR
jgi:hypothetical protein